MASKPTCCLDSFTLSIALKACSALSASLHGRAVHAVAFRRDFHHSDNFVAGALVEMYAKFRQMGDAVRLFDGIAEPDVVIWTAVVSGYQQNGDAVEARSFFFRMLVENHVIPNPVTLVSAVCALGQLGDARGGRCCHGFLLRMGFDHDISLMNSILNFYAKIGAVRIARKVFDIMPETDVISWSCLISCYARNGEPVAALKVFKRLTEIGLEPNSVTMVGALQACSLSRDLQQGRRIHELAIQKGFELDKSVATELVDVYMNCSCFKEAIHLFHRMPARDAVTWAAAIDGCAKNGFASESLKLFKTMLSEKINLDAVTMAKVSAACSLLGVLCQARCLHGYLIRSGFSDKIFVGSALLDLYSKCGSVDDAVGVFESFSERDVVLWSAMVAGFGVNGHGEKAMAAFECMIESSIRPTNITFISVLSSCSHNGMVREGRRVFDSMNRVYGVAPDSNHYRIMVDLLARMGELREALKMVEEMPEPVDAHVWCALLSGCRSHRDFEMGVMVAQRLLEIDSSCVGYYNLQANMYAFCGRWTDVEAVKGVIMERGLRKVAGQSAVEIGSEIHVWLAGEKMEGGSVSDLLRGMEVNMREEGYVSGGNKLTSDEECLLEVRL